MTILFVRDTLVRFKRRLMSSSDPAFIKTSSPSTVPFGEYAKYGKYSNAFLALGSGFACKMVQQFKNIMSRYGQKLIICFFAFNKSFLGNASLNVHGIISFRCVFYKHYLNIINHYVRGRCLILPKCLDVAVFDIPS